MIRRTIALAGVALAASLGAVVIPATSAQAAVRYCYAPSNRVVVSTATEVPDAEYGIAYESQVQVVRVGSPCRDLNLRSPRNASGPAAGQPVCTLISVRLAGWERGTDYLDVCGSWRVPVFTMVEGSTFTLRSAVRPVLVTVAT